MPIAERECHRPGSASIAMHVLHPSSDPARMTEDACRLDDEHRRLVEATIAEHCAIRGWTLYAVNCRSNHVHVVVAASPHPDEVARSVQGLVHAAAEDARSRTYAARIYFNFFVFYGWCE